MRSELMEEDRKAFYEAIESSLSDDVLVPLKKKAQSLADDIVCDIEWNLRDNLASNLSYHVRQMAERAIEALLAGNEQEMIRWLQCDKAGWNGRSDGYTGPNATMAGQHPIIHKVLHENHAVLLRRKIAEAHRDLIANERILDLEDQVKSLIEQNNKLEREKEALRERVRDLSPV